MSIKWIFFDIGSTLVDESRAYERRMREAVRNTDITYEQLLEKSVGFYRENKKGDIEAIRFFGLEKPRWYSEEEFPYPNAANILSRLSESFKIAVVANQGVVTQSRMTEMGLSKNISLYVVSYDVGVAKPDERIFRIALERAGCSPEEVVMIGDRLDNDVAPAKALGMKTIWVRQGFSALGSPCQEREIPDYTAENLNSVCEIIEKNLLC